MKAMWCEPYVIMKEDDVMESLGKAWRHMFRVD